MPDLIGLKILAIANAETLSTRLVFFTESIEHGALVAATAAGACSVIPKDADLKSLWSSLRQIANGWRLLLLEERSDAVAENLPATLTGREREIMRLVSE